jgi:8-oxo-dGTP diphosphatase
MGNVILQVAAKALIVNDDGKVLVLREPAKDNMGSQNGRYGLVGGRIDAEESFEAALHREVLEETGLMIEILYPIYVGEWSPTIKGQKCHIVAIFNVCQAKTTDVVLSTEHDDFKWINPADVKDYPFMPPDDQVIERYAKNPPIKI